MNRDKYYWHREEDEPHKALFSVVNAIEADQIWRRNQNKTVATLYRDRNVAGFSPGQWKFSAPTVTDLQLAAAACSAMGRPLTYNIIRSCIDTLVATLCLSRPLPKVLTSCADEDIRVCRTLSCALGGAYALHEHFCKKLGLDPHAHGAQTTKDGSFTVEFVECLASCGTAPVMMCNETFYEGVSHAKADEIIGGCR